MTDISVARQIASAVREAGGRAYFVGGYVRDVIMGIENKDIDIEVHGVSVEILEAVLDSVGERLQYGKSFGVYGIRGAGVDIALPRKEKCIGTGHADFKVDVDPFLGVEKASARRDFTVNAIMRDVLTGEIVDCHGGLDDLKNKVIRHVNDSTFAEDPLRVLRGAQFAARFGFTVAKETKELCRRMSLKELSSERVFEELKKAMLKAKKPSVFFRVLREIEGLDYWFPEVLSLIGVEQSPVNHAEGDVFEHTMAVIDCAATLRDKTVEPLPFMLSALTHDFGKVVTTEVINGKIHSYGHETEGLPLVKEFLQRLTNEKSIIRYVLNMTELHMRPNMLAGDRSSVKSCNRTFDASVQPVDLIYLSVADGMGSITQHGYYSNEEFLFERLAIYNEYMSRPHVTGEDLIEAGFTPGKTFSRLLEYAHKLRLAGVEKKSAMKQVVSYAEKIKKEES